MCFFSLLFAFVYSYIVSLCCKTAIYSVVSLYNKAAYFYGLYLGCIMCISLLINIIIVKHCILFFSDFYIWKCAIMKNLSRKLFFIIIEYITLVYISPSLSVCIYSVGLIFRNNHHSKFHSPVNFLSGMMDMNTFK